VVAVPESTFRRLQKNAGDCKLDPRIEVEELGVLDDSENVFFLACGYAFSDGFENYGTIFKEAEMLEGGNNAVSRKEQERPYIEAMKEIYGIDLPPCKLMVGCSSEN
jgi:hypothetical protein